MKEYAIQMQNISKQYYYERPRTLKKFLKNLFLPFHKFTVFKNYSLAIKKGEFIVISGSNGSGKTTLLKLIANITYPDIGTIKTVGKVTPLIELGSGFNYELTGRENIIINATILGVEKNHITKAMSEIIRFSGLHTFIDIPLKRYSTGMLTRLAFAIGISSDPDILLLDEIFAVGDREFRIKSIKKLAEFRKKGVTILLTSHESKETIFKPDRIVKLKQLHSI